MNNIKCHICGGIGKHYGTWRDTLISWTCVGAIPVGLIILTRLS